MLLILPILADGVDLPGSLAYQAGSPCELLVVRAVGNCVFSQSHHKILVLLEPLQRQREQVLELKTPKFRATFLKPHKPPKPLILLQLLLKGSLRPLCIGSKLGVEL